MSTVTVTVQSEGSNSETLTLKQPRIICGIDAIWPGIYSTDIFNAVVREVTVSANGGIGSASLVFNKKYFGEHILFGTPIFIAVDRIDNMIFRGVLTNETSNLGRESVEVTALDHKWWLTKNVIYGRYFTNVSGWVPNPMIFQRKQFTPYFTDYSHTGIGTSYNPTYGGFDYKDCVFNEESRPNKHWIGNSTGFVGFLPTITSYLAFSEIPYPKGNQETWWGWGDILAYLQRFYINPQGVPYVISAALINRLNNEYVYGKPMNFSIQGMTVAAAIDKVLNGIGVNFTWFVRYSNFGVMFLDATDPYDQVPYNDPYTGFINYVPIKLLKTLKIADPNLARTTQATKLTDEPLVSDITVSRDVSDIVTDGLAIGNKMRIENTVYLRPAWPTSAEGVSNADIIKYALVIQQDRQREDTAVVSGKDITKDTILASIRGRVYSVPREPSRLRFNIPTHYMPSGWSNQIDVAGLRSVGSWYRYKRKRGYEPPTTYRRAHEKLSNVIDQDPERYSEPYVFFARPTATGYEFKVIQSYDFDEEHGLIVIPKAGEQEDKDAVDEDNPQIADNDTIGEDSLLFATMTLESDVPVMQSFNRFQVPFQYTGITPILPATFNNLGITALGYLEDKENTYTVRVNSILEFDPTSQVAEAGVPYFLSNNWNNPIRWQASAGTKATFTNFDEANNGSGITDTGGSAWYALNAMLRNQLFMRITFKEVWDVSLQKLDTSWQLGDTLEGIINSEKTPGNTRESAGFHGSRVVIKNITYKLATDINAPKRAYTTSFTAENR